MTNNSRSHKPALSPDRLRVSLAALWVHNILNAHLLLAVRTLLYAMWSTAAFAAYTVFTSASAVPVLDLNGTIWSAAPASMTVGLILALGHAVRDAHRRVGKVRQLLSERLQHDGGGCQK